MNTKSESNGRWIWERPSGLLPGEDPPSLEDEILYLEVLIAEASQAIERAENHREKEKYRGYLRRATERYNEAVARLAALEMELGALEVEYA